MSEELIEVTIMPDGSIHAVTRGMHGDRCLDSFELLEDLTNGRIVDSKFTSDYTRTQVADGLQSGVLDGVEGE